MPDTKFNFFYRRPGETEHEKLTDVLDDIIIKLDELTQRVDAFLEEDTNPGLTD